LKTQDPQILFKEMFDLVEQVRIKLYRKGYKIRRLSDTIKWKSTILHYQKDYGLPITRHIDYDTWSKVIKEDERTQIVDTIKATFVDISGLHHSYHFKGFTEIKMMNRRITDTLFSI
jgi:hypothetical protein